MALAAPLPRASAETRPNVLFIVLDDLVPVSRAHVDDPGLLLRMLVPRTGARHALSGALTPNLNRLADRGITFTQTWTAYPLCNPSRVAVLTGISPARSGYIRNQGPTFRAVGGALSGAITIPERFRLAGYETLGIGKIFHSPYAEYDPEGRIVNDQPDLAHSWSSYIQTSIGTLSETRGDEKERVNLKKLCAIEKKPTADQPDWINAGLAASVLRNGTASMIDALQKPASLTIVPGKPFFLGIGIRRPHAPWAVPKEWLARIPSHLLRKAKLDLFAERADRRDIRGAGNGLGGKVGFLLGYDAKKRHAISSRKKLLRAISHYLAAIAFADACVGRVLDALDASPHAKNTIVVLWSDHGYSMGQKLHFGKNSLWESSLRGEFILADFRNPSSGRSVKEPVSLVDIYPTLFDLAGIDDGGYPHDGRSLANTVFGGNPTRIPISSRKGNHYAVRLGPWKLISHGGGRKRDELYHLNTDPLERKNLLFHPKTKALQVSRHLRVKMRRSLKQ